MLPIKLIRSVTHDRRAQHIGSAISVTNESAGLSYLVGTAHRTYIEKQARTAHINKYKGDAWVEKCYSDYFKARRHRNLKAKSKSQYKFLVV